MKFIVTDGPSWIKGYLPKLNSTFDKYFEDMLKGAWISVNFVSKEYMKGLNKNFSSVNHTTDILSFPFVFVDSPSLQEDEELGEVYIALEVVEINAKKLKVTTEEQALRVFIHGALHILGYEHKGSFKNPFPEDKEMFDMQETILEEVLE